jgi:hypothetical protein
MSRLNTVRALKHHGAQARLHGTAIDYEAIRAQIGAASSRIAETGSKVSHFQSFVSHRKTKMHTDTQKQHWMSVHRRLGDEKNVLERELSLCLGESTWYDIVLETEQKEAPRKVKRYEEEEEEGESDPMAEFRLNVYSFRDADTIEPMTMLLDREQSLSRDIQSHLAAAGYYSIELEAIASEFTEHDIPWELADIYDISGTMQTEYAKSLEMCKQAYDAEVASIQQQSSSSSSSTSTSTSTSSAVGSWSEDQKFRFSAVLAEYSSSGGTASRKTIRDRLMLEFQPDGKTVAEVEAYWDAIVAEKFSAQRMAAALRQYTVSMMEARRSIAATIVALADHFDATERAKQAEKEGEEARLRHVAAEKAMEERRADKRAQEEKMKLVEAEAREQAWMQFEEHRLELKGLVLQYKQAKLELEVQRKEMAELARELAREQQVKTNAVNRERVAFRIAKLQEKNEAKRKQLAEKEAEQSEREARLEALRALVRVEAESNPDRTMGATKASSTKFDVTEAERAELFADHGYRDHDLFRDPRFKLQHALHGAGVLNTDYAKRVLATTKTAVAPRRDMQSTVGSAWWKSND